MSRIAVVYHSGYGHTRVQAEAVARGAVGISGTKVSLIPVEEAEARAEEIDRADAIVFGAPTYMGSLSAPMKGFMDTSSKVWAEQGWKDKIAAGFTNSGSLSGDKLNALVQLAVFAAQHGMIWVGLDLPAGNSTSGGGPHELNRIGSWLGAMAQSNTDEGPDKGPIASDLATAEQLGRRVAVLAKVFTGARVAA